MAAVALCGLVETGCLVSIHHVSDPRAAFAAARAQAERDGLRPGRAHRLNVLAFDPEERTLVSVSLPIWLAGRIQRHVKAGEETDRALERSVGERLARRIRVEDLAAAGRGLIADVEDDEGQVLVWLR